MKRIRTIALFSLGGILLFAISLSGFLAAYGSLNLKTLSCVPLVGIAFPYNSDRGEIRIDPIKVNPRGCDMSQMLRGRFVVSYKARSAKEALAIKSEYENPVVRGTVKEAIWELCRNKQSKEFRGDENLNLLKKEIASKVEQALFSKYQGKITEVFFEEFRID